MRFWVPHGASLKVFIEVAVAPATERQRQFVTVALNPISKM
jgi:hypothetical protein